MRSELLMTCILYMISNEIFTVSGWCFICNEKRAPDISQAVNKVVGVIEDELGSLSHRFNEMSNSNERISLKLDEFCRSELKEVNQENMRYLKQNNLLLAKIRNLEMNISEQKQPSHEQAEKIEKMEAQLSFERAKNFHLGNDSKSAKQRLTETEKLLQNYIALIESKEVQMRELEGKSQSDANQIQKLEAQLEAYDSYCQAKSCLMFGSSTDVHVIKPRGVEPFEALCNGEVAGPGWIVIQQRLDGSVNFRRNWTEYQKGFGSLRGEFFMGLEILHRITVSEPYELYIQLEDFENATRYARYDLFEIGSAEEDYALNKLGAYSGNAGDALRLNWKAKFSTFDRNNDASEGNCAQDLAGGWWYYRCGFSNLNGEYLIADSDYRSVFSGIFWAKWRHLDYSLKSVLMMIRPKAV
ncbi:microfibril-associated glycoprotein 4-like [Drosophila hydei]|uniref:Microfibril-associated glycoprotein 4-like n=1 Tax=Drosophila hydei TaxID=7224 RepID=A0A6J1LER7_DROHY|nr:microfibril-associated glycoprotein 4-like [Drosophila hydei]